ncbi:uncharacterized protein TRIVIDRAFT_210445 [Trichoderma virens Gv29-8]|uniref:Uncharacterized protein n=1 Tax=Hypocrea virens (strain Gv29-8 / FGSC 10586) TaxID=413071 RepID=G9N6F8_HYPVG|nr:uncharacterized protein TRIVIDRAFT_210445 [Trichoderma virens Gv29-8]EHK17719.1 hypothetical protein TRIVIDRAFT_210445 [Trichoderma virens Gv29-8]
MLHLYQPCLDITAHSASTLIHLPLTQISLLLKASNVLGMPRDGDPLDVFVRFKQHVDTAFHSLLQPHQPQLPSDSQSDLSTSKSPDNPISDSSNHTAPLAPVTMDSLESRPLALDTVSVASWAYSPANLRHLRQPVPSDLPSQYDSSVFTFEDAFEDLLTVSLGRPLPDIKSRYNQRQLLRQMFSNGEPTWFWLRRLESQGLLRRPTRDELYYQPRNFGLFENDAEPEFPKSNWNDWSKFHEELDRKAAEVWGSAAAGEQSDSHGTSFFDEVRQTFKQLDDSFHGRNKSQQEGHENHHQKRFPDHFDDLFSSLSSSFAEGHKTWDTFVKSITDSKPVSIDSSASPPSNSSEEKVYDNGNREVVTRDEKVNSLGYLTTTVTKKTYDKNGNEIGVETHFTMRPADKTQKNEAGGSNDTNVIEREADDQQTKDKKSGWFWK